MMHGSTTDLHGQGYRRRASPTTATSVGFDVAFEYGTSDLLRRCLQRQGHAASDRGRSRTPRPPGHGAVASDVDDVDALHADLVKRGAKVLKAPTNHDYGLRDFRMWPISTAT